jgi:uncharacterized alkaline shock family protein YloU
MDKAQGIPGSVTVETEVLETIARLTALEVPGVVGIAERDVAWLVSKTEKSVQVMVKNGKVYVDLHIVAGPDYSLLKLGKAVQHEVTRAIQQMIGMPVDSVNVHITDVVYGRSEPWTEAELSQ